jgi:uncharacterized protein
MIRSAYLRAYDRLLRRPRLALAVVACVSGGAVLVVPGIALDMSFRPLFGQDEGAIEATRAFEELFGQRSGAHVGAIVTPKAWDAELVIALVGATRSVERLEYVTEVVALTRAARPVWGPDSVTTRWLIDTLSLRPPVDMGAVHAARAAPELARTLVSEDGTSTVLLVRLALPLDDLEGRARVIRRMRAELEERLGALAELHWVGVSVVEEAYARLVLEGLGVSFVLTTLVLLVALGTAYRRAAAVVAVLAGVSMAVPVAAAAMVARGQAVTIVNSMVPTMILIIGVADAIHMFECFAGHIRGGRPRADAVRTMFGEMALPCLLTSLTTIAGVMALQTAHVEALRSFGANVAIGMVAVYLANLIALPALLLSVPTDRLVAPRRPTSLVSRWLSSTSALLVRHPGSVAGVFVIAIVACASGIVLLDIEQRFNEDVASDHPVRIAQARYEAQFTGMLGPDVLIRRSDGSSLLGIADRARLAAVVAAIEALPGVLHVGSALDLLPAEVGGADAVEGLLRLRRDPRLGATVRELVDDEGVRTALAVRTADIGSRAALDLVEDIERAAARELGSDFEASVVGQWWLAQLGLSNILRDMLVGFGTSFLLVLPLLAVALGSARLFALGLVPNLLPPIFALGFMGWTGISVRVGTAMILAIVLAIAVDDTIHVLLRLRDEAARTPDPAEQVRRTLAHTGAPLLLTTVVLVAGFLSMRVNGLVAIQDMGLVAAATLGVAFLADAYFLPACHLVAHGAPRSRRVRAAHGARRGVRAPDTSADV